ncbi:MAG: hypothetical protein HOJ13_01800 [Nitrospina sp.]|nr:hypothetical protein [Nitrospina sp.]
MNSLKDADSKPNTSGSFFCVVLGVLFLGLVLSLPSGIRAMFDGLPWTGEAETLVLAVIIPSLLILGWRFLSLRFSILYLCALLFLKGVLFLGSPSSGWVVKMHPNISKENLAGFYPFPTVEEGNWVKTYATIWNEEASGILKSSWTEKMDFPLDWVLTLAVKCGNSGVKCFDKLSPVVEIDGVIEIQAGEKFALIAEGVQDGTLLAINEKDERVVILPAKNSEEVAKLQYQFLHGGKWEVSGKLHYKGKKWSLIPTMVDAGGEISLDLGRGVLWQNKEDLSNSQDYIDFYKILSFIVDGGIIVFLLAWLVSTALSLVDQQILNSPIALFSISGLFLPIILAPIYSGLLNIVNSPDVTTISYLGFSISLVSVCFLVWTQWKRDFRNYQVDRVFPSVFLLFGPAMLFYFTRKWWFALGQWQIWGSGDDWTVYQQYGHKIVVEGEWLRAAEDVLYMQPLYRYFVGIYHGLFGQSAFVQHMADVWCVLGATIIIVAFAIKLRISPLVVFITSTIYLAINLIAAFRYHIGKGLVENHAMIYMMLAAWFLYKAREGGMMRITLATIFGIFGYWTRQDHLGAIAGIAFLALEPVEGPTNGWRGYWDRFKLNWKVFAVYWGAGILSVLALCFRNWWLGGVFFPTSKAHTNIDFSTYDTFPDSIYTVLTGKFLPAFPGLPGYMVMLGVIVALLAMVWRPRALSNFPLGLSISILGLLAPYILLVTWGYPPRYTIHILPLAILSCGIILNSFFDSHKLRSKLND